MKQIMTRQAAKLIVWFCLACFVFIVLPAFAPTHPAPPPARGSVQELETHFNHCWNSALAGKPHYVIYRYRKTNWRIGGQARVNEALSAIFGVFDTGLVVAAFCDKRLT